MPSPRLFNGVDITPLEGWLTKFKSKGKFFGTTNKRWFKVDIANPDCPPDILKLTLNYYKTKKATEPRGWIYLEDVVEINSKPDLIEIISPSRVLRLKGETTAEHRMWLESLRQLCFPETNVSVEAKSEAPEDNETAQEHTEFKEDSIERDQELYADSYASNEVPQEKSQPEDAPCEKKYSSPSKRSRPPVIEDEEKITPAIQEVPRKQEVSVEDTRPISIDDEDGESEAKSISKARQPSLLNLQSRDASQRALEFSDSEESGDDEEEENETKSTSPSISLKTKVLKEEPSQLSQDGNTPSSETRAEEITSNNENTESKPSTTTFDDDDETEVETFQNSPKKAASPKKSASPKKEPKRNSAYFDEDEEEAPSDPNPTPTKVNDMHESLAQQKQLMKDWDEDAEPAKQPSPVKQSPAPHSHGVTADANFVNEDWD